MRSAAKTRIRTLTVLTAVVAALVLPAGRAVPGPAAGLQQPAAADRRLREHGRCHREAGNAEVKIAAAKRAAAAALSRAAGGGSVEVAVLAFSGDCSNPVPRYQDFTRDVDRLTRFIASLQPGGGTPMADALLFANRFLAANGSAGAADRMIMLLADGQNDCGDDRPGDGGARGQRGDLPP